MPTFLKTFYRRHHQWFIAVFLGIFSIVWIILPVVGKAPLSETSTAISFAVLAVYLSVLQGYANDIHNIVGKLDANRHGAKTFPDQVCANSALISWIQSHTISEARLLEYDGDSIKPVVFTLLQRGVHVHLLLQHPDFACSAFQRNRVLHQIAVREREFSDYGDLIQIEYYRPVASLRGRLFDRNLLSLSWYTYDKRTKSDEVEVWGHNNPVVIVEESSEPFQHLSDFFSKVFAHLQRDAESYESLEAKTAR